MILTIPRPTDARALPWVSEILLAAFLVVACGNAPKLQTNVPAAQAGQPVQPGPDEKSFSTDDGWSFLAPKDFERNNAPGTTGFAVYRPPPAKPILNIVFTTEGFDGDRSAFVDKERAKVRIVKEQATDRGVVVEETWPIGQGEHGVAMVLLTVDNGVGIRLACLTGKDAFESQRAICERAIGSLRRLRKTP